MLNRGRESRNQRKCILNKLPSCFLPLVPCFSPLLCKPLSLPSPPCLPEKTNERTARMRTIVYGILKWRAGRRAPLSWNLMGEKFWNFKGEKFWKLKSGQTFIFEIWRDGHPGKVNNFKFLKLQVADSGINHFKFWNLKGRFKILKFVIYKNYF